MRIGTAALSMLVLVMLAGCGSGRLSHGSYVTRANEICSQYDASVKKLRRPATVIQWETYARRTGRLYRTALAQLETLRPAKEDEATVATWLATDRRIARGLDAVEAAARARRIPAMSAAAARVEHDNRRSNSLAKLLGVTECAARR